MLKYIALLIGFFRAVLFSKKPRYFKKDIYGEYYSTTSAGDVYLKINQDLSWQQTIVSSGLISTGKWGFESVSLDSKDVIQISLEKHKFGFKRFPLDPESEGVWFADFYKTYDAQVKTCINDKSICYVKKSLD